MPAEQLNILLGQRSIGWINAFLLFVLLLSSGCDAIKPDGHDDPMADHSFVTGEPCEAPCWYGLELDKSTQQEILDTLSALPFVDASSIFTSTSTWKDGNASTVIYFGCIHPEEAHCGVITVSKNQLKFLYLTVGFPLTLETAIGKLGPPNYMIFDPIVGVGGCMLDLFWPEKNVTVTSRNPNSSTLCYDLRAGKKISPLLLATEITYVVKDGFGSQIEVFPWPGFSQP